MKDLIILFIKLQFSIRYNQAFRPLCTSILNIYLNLNLNPNGLSLVSFPMHLYYPQYASWFQTYTSRGLYI